MGLLLPVVALATVVTLPFSDRPTQAAQLLSYLSLVGAVVAL
jgi:hypothetical protein